MLKKLALFSILIFSTMMGFSEQNPLEGSYELKLSQSRSFQRHYLNIKNLSDTKITGEIGLDFNLGPEARSPLPWERLHEIPFEGTYNPQSGQLAFVVQVKLAREVKYFFNGYFVFAEPMTIVGIYQLGDKKVEGGFFAQKKIKNR